MKKSWIKAITVLVTLMFAVCANAASFGQSADKRVEVIDLKLDQNQSYGLIIKGIAVNRSAKIVKSVFVKFNLYDENNSLVGNTVTMAQNLGPGETWSFSVPTPVKFATAKISEVETYDN